MTGHPSPPSDLALNLGMSQAPLISDRSLIAIVHLSTELFTISYMGGLLSLFILILYLEWIRYFSDLIRAPPFRRQFMRPFHGLLMDKDEVSSLKRVSCHLFLILTERTNFFPNFSQFFPHVFNKLVSILLSDTSGSVQQVGGEIHAPSPHHLGRRIPILPLLHLIIGEHDPWQNIDPASVIMVD